MNPEELYTTTMNPANRHLTRLTTADFQKTIDLYNELMGKRPELRRNFILEHKLSKFVADDVFDEDDGDVE